MGEIARNCFRFEDGEVALQTLGVLAEQLQI
jgi:hypothetical protein